MTSTVDPAFSENAPATPVLRNVGSESYSVEVFYGSLSGNSDSFTSIDAQKTTRADRIIAAAVQRLDYGNPEDFELVEVFTSGGQICKERRLFDNDNPVKIQLLWPRLSSTSVSDAHQPGYQFVLRRKEAQQKAGVWVNSVESNPVDRFLTHFLQQPRNREYQDLCNLPDLNETTLLENLKKRFNSGMIYTYVGSILISINPFRFYPIYNPKYIRMYQNKQLSDLPPHIFAIADSAYHTMAKMRANQCIVISGESGSGKTESTNLLMCHLSALSQRGLYSDGIEQSILGVGPVLEAFGNAKTVHNNNSSRFGKFVQVNYRANGSVHGASVEKYLLEKSRIVSQASNERNYHVFYYLLAGANTTEIESFCLGSPREYFYLNQNDCYRLEGLDSDCEAQEFRRLLHAMDVVGFSHDNQQRIFTILSAVLHIGNIEFKKKSEHGYHDEAVSVKNMKEISIVSQLLKVKETTLIEALTKRKTMAGGDVVVMSYKMAEAISTRDAMSKCLYSALFDWIVFQINTALVSKHDVRKHKDNSIGVLDIFGFEDFQSNSFEQFCINYANESLHYYFNQHIFKFEQEEYMREGIQWKNIEFIDNTECLDLFCKKPTGLLYLLDEECSFPGATNETLLNKFNAQHQSNPHFDVPQTRQTAFSIIHYAGKVKYCSQDFREKNSDLMRHDILVLLKNSNLAFLRELIGQDPLAVLRWALVRVFFRACFAFIDAGRRHRKSGVNVSRFGGILRPEPFQKKLPLRAESKTSLFGDKNKSVPEQRFGHSPSLDSSSVQLPSLFSGWRKSNRRLSCPGDNKAIVEASKKFERQKLEQSPLPEENSPTKSQKILSSIKNKVHQPRFQAVRQLREMETNKTLSSGKVPIGIRTNKNKTKPRSISAQFHNSLQQLMDTLNQANPFFIRCIKSNADKAPCLFDEELVQRQLRYTGMLATVKIRQSGYNYRLSFEDFIYQYHFLLPNGRRSSRNDIINYLHSLDLNQENYQIGATKVFLRETEKLLLEDALHQALLVRIRRIQRWIKGRLQRIYYLQIRSSTVILQSVIRGILARRKAVQLKNMACTVKAVVDIQRVARGFLTRQRLLREKERQAEDEEKDRIISQPSLLESKMQRHSEQAAINIKNRSDEAPELKSNFVEGDQLCANHMTSVDGKDVSSLNVRTGHASRGSVMDQKSNSITIESYLPSLNDSVASAVVKNKDDMVKMSSDVSLNQRNEPNIKIAESSECKISDFCAKDCISSKASSEEKTPCRSLLTDSVGDASISVVKLFPAALPAPAKSIKDETLVSGSTFKSENYNNRLHSRTVDSSRTKGDANAKYEPRYVVDRSGSKDDLYLVTTPADRALFSLDNSSTEDDSSYSKDEFAESNQTKPFCRDQDLKFPDAPMAKGSCRSAPHSPSGHAEESKSVFDLDFVSEERKSICRPKIHRDSPSTRRIEKCQSAIIPNIRTQDGPQDLEIELKPIIVKASSEEILSSNSQVVSRSSLGEKQLQAPLARMESISDEPAQERGVETINVIIEDDVKKTIPPKKELDENVTGSKSHDSSHQSKTKTKKRQNKAKDGSTSEGNEQKTKNFTPLRQKALHQPSTPSQLSGTAKGTTDLSTNAIAGSWSVSGTAQWKYPLSVVVHNINELKQLEHFFATKTCDVRKNAERKNASVYDRVFKEALNEFHSNLIPQISTSVQENIVIHKYNDLMCNFEEILSAKARLMCKEDSAFPNTVFINAFRGFVDEFIKKRDNKELPDVKVKKDSVKGKKKKDAVVLEYLGHKFLQIQFTMQTFCEMCSSGIWVLEKGYVCKACKFTVHKKCYEKSQTPCTASFDQAAVVAQVGTTIIGVPLSVLIQNDHQIPPVIEKLIGAIEMNGMYSVGVYRKPGNAAQIKQLIKDINNDASNIEFGEYNIYVLTSVLKAFFRDMPEPLLTFDLYEDFIRIAGMNDEKERIKSLFSLLTDLPQANHTLLERLIFHLARVAQLEESNLMSPNALAIIFAPSILRTQNELSTQESLSHIPKQTLCVQSVIEWQLKKIKSTLADIQTLDSAADSANEKLATLRASFNPTMVTEIEAKDQHQPETPEENREEIKMLSEQIRSLEDKKEILTNHLSSFECRLSFSEDELLSTDDVESTGDELDDCDCESPISTSDNESVQRVVRNLTRHRNRPPPKKTDKYRFVIPPLTPDSPFQLKPARSDPELHKSFDDPFQ